MYLNAAGISKITSFLIYNYLFMYILKIINFDAFNTDMMFKFNVSYKLLYKIWRFIYVLFIKHWHHRNYCYSNEMVLRYIKIRFGCLLHYKRKIMCLIIKYETLSIDSIFYWMTSYYSILKLYFNKNICHFHSLKSR